MNVTHIPHDSCTGCGACLNICPQGCISMKLDEEKFFYPEIDEKACVNCNRCSAVCPVNKREEVKKGLNEAYAVMIKDEKIRAESSSGGGVQFTVRLRPGRRRGSVWRGAV